MGAGISYTSRCIRIISWFQISNYSGFHSFEFQETQVWRQSSSLTNLPWNDIKRWKEKIFECGDKAIKKYWVSHARALTNCCWNNYLESRRRRNSMVAKHLLAGGRSEWSYIIEEYWARRDSLEIMQKWIKEVVYIKLISSTWRRLSTILKVVRQETLSGLFKVYIVVNEYVVRCTKHRLLCLPIASEINLFSLNLASSLNITGRIRCSNFFFGTMFISLPRSRSFSYFYILGLDFKSMRSSFVRFCFAWLGVLDGCSLRLHCSAAYLH